MAITTFIPEVWAARLLEHYTRNLVFGSLVNRNYEGEISQYGDTVHINSIEDVTVKDYTPNTDIENPEQLTTTDQTLMINHGKYYNFYVDDVDKVQARGDLMDAAMRNAARLLAEDTEDYIASTIVSEAGIKTGLTGAVNKDNVYAAIIAIKTALDKENVPREGRWLVVPSQVEGLLLQNDLIIRSNGQRDRNDLTGGAVAMVAGFQLHCSNALTDKMIASNNEAITFANQLTKTEAYRPEKKFADGVRGLNLCGAKVTRPKAVAVYTITA